MHSMTSDQSSTLVFNAVLKGPTSLILKHPLTMTPKQLYPRTSKYIELKVVSLGFQNFNR